MQGFIGLPYLCKTLERDELDLEGLSWVEKGEIRRVSSLRSPDRQALMAKPNLKFRNHGD